MGEDYKKQEWYLALDERDRKHVDLAFMYSGQFAHGTIGHNLHMLIATLAGKLFDYYLRLQHREHEISELVKKSHHLESKISRRETEIDRLNQIVAELKGKIE